MPDSNVLKLSMSDFPSINDLNSSAAGVPKKNLTPATEKQGQTLGKKMDEIKKMELEVKASRFAASIGIPHIDLTKFPITHESLRQITKEEAEEHGVVCFFAGSDEIRLGALDPTKPDVEKILKNIEIKKHGNGAVYVISEVSFQHVLELYDKLPTVKAISKDRIPRSVNWEMGLCDCSIEMIRKKLIRVDQPLHKA